jgi:DNA-binding winged helix-turn-helix (wHTH) protein
MSPPARFGSRIMRMGLISRFRCPRETDRAERAAWGDGDMTFASTCIATYRFDRFIVDRDDERLHGPAGPIRIGNKAFRVLVRLLEQRNRLVTKDDLMETVWDGTIVTESALTSVIKELRKALCDDARTPNFIACVYGRGYRFLCPVEHAGAEDGACASTAARRADEDEHGARFAWPPVAVPAATVAGGFPRVAGYRRFAHGGVVALLATSIISVIPSGPAPSGTAPASAAPSA